MSLVTGPFFAVCFLNQRWTPSLRFQVSHCSAFGSMCDVPSTAVFCKESIGCVPGIACRFFFKLRVTIPVAPIITGVIVHFRIHIRSISMPKALVFELSLHFLLHDILVCKNCHIYQCTRFLFFVFNSSSSSSSSSSYYYYYYYYL